MFSRRGVTLIELLVVLAVLLLLTGLSMPALRRPWLKSELREAARELAAELGKTRLVAIESGEIRQFRYLPGTPSYAAAPATCPLGDEPALVDPPAAANGEPEAELTELTAGEDPHLSQIDERELPGRAWFAPVDEPLVTETAFEDSLVADPLGAPAGVSVQSIEEKWSPPLVFYPSGQSSAARIRLRGASDYYVDVVLRGLTGGVTIGEIRRIEPANKLVEGGAADEMPAEPSAPFGPAAASPLPAETVP